MATTYDAIIIGTGQAGPFLARRLATAGMKVAIIERKLFGGTCVNTGCISTKTLVASAYAARMARRASEFGVLTGAVNVDMKRVKARKNAVSGGSRKKTTMPDVTCSHMRAITTVKHAERYAVLQREPNAVLAHREVC